MKPAARYQASIDLWTNITKAPVPMDAVCGDYFRGRRYIGSKDRANIAERAYNMMRAYARLNWWCERLSLDASPRSLVLLTAFFIDECDQETISNYFSGEKYHPDALNDEEEKIVSQLSGELNHSDMADDVVNECPQWAFDRLRALYGDDFENQMQAMLQPATLDVRVNTLKGDVDTVQTMLAKDKIKTDKAPYSPVGLRLQAKAYLAHSKAFKKGMIEIQDEGSQLLGLICHAKPGMQVLDYCAGGGGKALALAADMGGKGRIVAMDIDGRRLAKAKPRLTKADVHNVELRSLDEDKHKKWLKRQNDKFDIVLVDAPCSSSGTWRRNPDLKWHHFGPEHSEIEKTQSDILDRVWNKTKIGGRLVYATCSIFTEENEKQIEDFLKRNDNFKIIPPADIWATKGEPSPCPSDNNYLRLSPYTHNTDGFFACVLERLS